MPTQPRPPAGAAAPSAAGDFDASAIRAAIIDLDGTMVDTSDDFNATLNGMLAELGAPPIERDETIRYIGKGSEHLVRTVLAARSQPVAAEALAHALDIYQRHYAQINGRHARLYPEVEAGLRALRAGGTRLGCVTNKPHRFAVALLEHYRLLDYFDVVYGGDSWPLKKPDPFPMLKACAALGVEPAATVAIGDSENDAHAARAAGMASFAVPYGFNHGNPVQAINADAIVATLLQAAHLIHPTAHVLE